MNFRILFFCALGTLLAVTSCKQNKMTDAERAEQMITARTLGLAYLEENKLEEAREEFLKVVELAPDEVLGYANLGIVYLRLGEYREAEQWLEKAIDLDPQDPDARLILAKVCEMAEQPGRAVEQLEKIMEFSPGHVKALYQLTELYNSSDDEESAALRRKYLEELIVSAPGNIVPRLNLTEIMIRSGELDPALEQLEKLPQLFPEFPQESVEFYKKTLTALRSGDRQEAATNFMIFHNYLKVTSPYQAGINDLKGPGGSLIGFPVITFDQKKTSPMIADWKTLLESIRFTDVTASSGLDFLMAEAEGEGVPSADEAGGETFLLASDYDGDGDTDLYAGAFDAASGTYSHYLLNNEWGKYSDVSAQAGIGREGTGYTGRFADFNNDGFLDLYVVLEEQDILYEGSGEGMFSDRTKKSGLSHEGPAHTCLFFDYDHDGDLDLYLARDEENLLFRNNADGTFIEAGGAAGLSGSPDPVETTDAVFGDFDDDGDIDLIGVSAGASGRHYSNQRQGVFREVGAETGLSDVFDSRAVDAGDYNNDGFLDLFVSAAKPGESRLMLNRGDGTFLEDTTSEEVTVSLAGMSTHDGRFIDFDNDGYLDLVVVGAPEKPGEKAAYLFHNDGAGKFWLSPGILPEDLTSGRKIVLLDYNEDGDLDMLVTGLKGGVRFLRNDGGNNNHYVKMTLVGLRTGSAKNNYYGIGAKVEMRAGNLYQSKVVTRPGIHFGLGPRGQADVIRILWTNGVPQNMFFPGSNQDLIEEQILKGSCPFLYAWNGQEFRFVKDFMWKSALGMPLGIMAEGSGDMKYAPAGASVDYIKIPGEMLSEKDGRYSLQVTGELWETIYVDKLHLIAVDHPDSIDIYVDERMGPPSMADYRIFQVHERRVPVSARTREGVDVLDRITAKDDRYVSGFMPGRFQGFTERSELELDLGDIDPEKGLFLYLNGWIFPSDASINASIAQSDAYGTIAPVIEAAGSDGCWRTVVPDLSYPMGKDKTIVVDLSGRVLASDPRIRIVSNMQVYWDRIFFTEGQPGAPVHRYAMVPAEADLHYRGFSATYRKGGRYGPHWFDYSRVTTEPLWRDLEGWYTRYGDVQPLLLEADNMYVIKNAGDETTIHFDAGLLPALPEGWSRDFLLHSVGWVKDGDLNTATGQTVEPLPFHGMTEYPYGEQEAYPAGPIYEEYRKTYNTRKVTDRDFQRFLSGKNLE